MKHILINLFIWIISCAALSASDVVHEMTIEPRLPLQNKVLEGSFIGKSGNTLLYGGGVTDTSNGHFTFVGNDVYRVRKTPDGYTQKQLFKLPQSVAFPAYCSTSQGLILAGGVTPQGPVSNVFMVSDSLGAIKELPQLPVSIYRAGFGVLKNKLILAGGIQDGTPSNKVWMLDLHKLKQGWQSMPDLPIPSMIDGACVVQNNGVEDRLYIFGQKIFSYSASLHDWFEETATEKVKQVLPAFERSIASAWGTHHILFPNIDGKVWAFHTISKTVIPIQDWETSQGAHFASIFWDDALWLLDGNDLSKAKFYHHASFGFFNYVVLILYLLLMVGIGFYFSRKAKTSDQFFKGGGQIPWWAAGISIFATTLSAITFMAIPAKTYTSNWLYFPMSFSILLIAPVIIHWYLPFFRKLNLTSAYEYLEYRFNVSVRLVSSLLFIIFMITRIAIVLYLPSVALSTVTGISILTCILIMSIITLLYATIGGVEAVIWGDVIQGGILLGGALLSVIYIVFETGGLGETIQIGEEAHKFKMLDFAFDFSQPTFWVIFFGAGMANTLITYSSDQTIIQRYFTTHDMKAAKRSLWTNGLIALPALVLFYFIGTALYSYYTTKPELLPVSMSNAEGIFPYFIVNELPNGVAGLLIAAIFAATMSTLSSNINSVSTAITCDFVMKVRKDIKDKSIVRVAQVSGIIACSIGMGLAVILSTMSVKSFFDEFNTFIGLLTSGLGGLFFIGIFIPRIKGYAALCGLVGSTLLLLVLRNYSSLNFMMYGLVGIALSIVIGYLLSFVFNEKERPINGLTWSTRKQK